MAEFLTTSAISAAVEQIINDAKQQVLLISPYLKISQRMKDLLVDADLHRRTVKVVFGKNELQPDESEWLQKLTSVQLFFRKNLHAKCYLNEQMAVVTSMNLYEFSQVNNDEMGILVRADSDLELYAKVAAEAERLIRMAEAWRFRFEKVATETQPRVAHSRRVTSTDVVLAATGFCIRCAENIPLNPIKPYCADDYARWAEYANPNYRDKHCHMCGEKHPATMRRPLCDGCYSLIASDR